MKSLAVGMFLIFALVILVLVFARRTPTFPAAGRVKSIEHSPLNRAAVQMTGPPDRPTEPSLERASPTPGPNPRLISGPFSRDRLHEILSTPQEPEFEQYQECKTNALEATAFALEIAQDPNELDSVKFNALRLLANLRSREAVPVIIKAISEMPDATFRVLLIRSLLEYGESQPVEFLESKYPLTTDLGERIYLIRGMGCSGDPRFMKTLEQARLSQDESGDSARRSISQIEILKSPHVETDLVVASRSDDDIMRDWAVETIRDRRFPASASYLRDIFEEQLTWSERKRSMWREYTLLSGIQELGGSLSEEEAKYLKNFKWPHGVMFHRE